MFGAATQSLLNQASAYASDSLAQQFSNPYLFHNLATSGIDNVRFCGLQPEQALTNGNCSNLALSCLNCDWTTYGIRMAQLAGAPIALGVLCFLASFVLLFVICCNCCVKKCAPSDDKPNNRICVFIFMAICIAGAGVGLVITLTGNDAVGRGVGSLGGTILTTMQQAVDRMELLSAKLNQTEYTNSSSAISTIQDAITLVRDLRTSAADVKTTYVDRFETYRHAALYVGAIVPPVALGLALLLFCCKVRGFVGIIAWAAMFVVILVWLSLAVHVAVSEVTHDVCDEVGPLLNSTTSSNATSTLGSQSPLALLTQCKTGSGGVLSNLNATVDAALGSALGAGCYAAYNVCDTNVSNPYPPFENYTVVTCDEPKGGWCNSTSLPQFPSKMINDSVFYCLGDPNPRSEIDSSCVLVSSVSVMRSISECSTSCNNTRLKALSVDIVKGVDLITIFINAANDIKALLNCDFIASAFDLTKDLICSVMTDGMKQIYSGNALQAFGLVIGSIILVIAHHSLPG